jgi:hypothetical protein
MLSTTKSKKTLLLDWHSCDACTKYRTLHLKELMTLNMNIMVQNLALLKMNISVKVCAMYLHC